MVVGWGGRTLARFSQRRGYICKTAYEVKGVMLRCGIMFRERNFVA